MTFVKTSSKSYITLCLVFFLLFVILGSGLSFHSESHEGITVHSTSDLGTQSRLEAQDHDNSTDADACVEGFCHLGHCGHLLLPKVSGSSLGNDLKDVFHSLLKTPLQCDIEGPFQPPRQA